MPKKLEYVNNKLFRLTFLSFFHHPYDSPDKHLFSGIDLASPEQQVPVSESFYSSSRFCEIR